MVSELIENVVLEEIRRRAYYTDWSAEIKLGERKNDWREAREIASILRWWFDLKNHLSENRPLSKEDIESRKISIRAIRGNSTNRRDSVNRIAALMVEQAEYDLYQDYKQDYEEEVSYLMKFPFQIRKVRWRPDRHKTITDEEIVNEIKKLFEIDKDWEKIKNNKYSYKRLKYFYSIDFMEAY